jgi:hypothetical protein
MYLFISPKIMFLKLKIPLLEEEAASSPKPTLDHSNQDKGVKQRQLGLHILVGGA